MTAHRHPSRYPSGHRRALVGGLLALTTVAGCASSGGAGSSEPTGATSTSVAPTSEETTPTAEETASSDVVAPIEGTWSTPVLDPAAFRQALQEEGLGEHAPAFVSELGETVDLTLEIDAGFWTLSAAMDDQAGAMVDRGTYELKGGQVLVRPHSGGENIYRWKVDGSRLALAFMSTTEPPYEGVPADVFQRAYYTTSAFDKESS